MPLPGGPADKFGNRYERWWTVSQLIHILHGQAESIRIEDPGITKAEFVIIKEGKREFHQAKRSHQDGKSSLASLGSSDTQLLQAIFDQLSGNDAKFIFASGSDAPELRELTDRAQSALNVDEFESTFIAADAQKRHFDKLRTYWKNASTAVIYGILRRVEIRTVDERTIEEKVGWGLGALFLADAAAISSELRSFADDSIHQIVTREGLVDFLARRGFPLRRVVGTASAAQLIHEVTSRYLTTVRKKLIRKKLIPRHATTNLLAKLAQGSEGQDLVVIGKAGVGKTGCVIELVEGLQKRDTPVVVLAFRLDRVDPASTPTELGRQLGLEESPTLVLAAVARDREAVLVIDQLDAVSTTSGRGSDFLETVEALLAEARGLRERLKLHVVLVCRAFDWQNDHRLRKMLPKEAAPIEVGEFSADEVRQTLLAEGYNADLFQSQQLQLLRLAQNLSLFLDAAFDTTKAPTFNTAKELFDRYWSEKRQAVATRATPAPEQWNAIVAFLSNEMTRTQQLSVGKEKLDSFSSEYVAQMASEGVLTFDGQRYGFGHESFFDYCFARGFVAGDESLVDLLTSSEQHLFRRAQVRQVLAYLRDADPLRYRSQLVGVLEHESIRPHIKDLTIAFLVSVPQPSDDEWVILESYLNSEMAAFSAKRKNPNKLASLAWQHFFASPSWFFPANRRGLVASWLASDSDGISIAAVNYLRFHQRHAGDQVAELLEPYADRGAEWTRKLRFIMEWADHQHSRRFFELFLRLVENGTLDDARGPIASNSTFWSMLTGMQQARPEWIAEVLAHWLRRRVAIAQLAGSKDTFTKWRNLFNHDDFGSTTFHDSAARTPEAFVQHVFPAVLETSDLAVYSDEISPPKRDAVWPIFLNSEHLSADAACLNALASAMESLAGSSPELLCDRIADLRRRETYTANFLLLVTYTAGSKSLADEAALLLSDQQWRFHCGYSDNGFWIAMRLIKAIVPLCTPANRQKLEDAILKYSPDYERTADRRHLAGSARFHLLSAIAPEYRSTSAQARYEELERKFGGPPAPPEPIRVYSVESPIKQESGEKMSDEQWLKAIAKYSSTDRLDRWTDPQKGGAWELAGMLREFVRNEPERFARLSLKFPANTHPAYLQRTLDGLKGTNAPAELKVEAIRKAYSENRVESGRAIVDLLGSIDESLPDDAMEMLNWLVTEHPEPDEELWRKEPPAGPYYGGDILTHGINTTRGRAAEAIRDLIYRDASYVSRFSRTLESAVSDTSIAVRSCVASALIAVARHDTSLALGLFGRLVATEDCLLATHFVERFIFLGLGQHFDTLRPHVERMLRSKDSKVGETGARLASLGALAHPEADILAQEAAHGSSAQRLGLAQVVSRNIEYPQYRDWCINYLLTLFNDEDGKVRHEAASCFRYMGNQDLERVEDFIRAFCDSLAYQEDSWPILHLLDESTRRLPGITCVVCEKFLERFSDEAKDITTHRAGDSMTISNLIFRTYHQHQGDEWARRSLNLIDRMCLEGVHEIKKGFDEFER